MLVPGRLVHVARRALEPLLALPVVLMSMVGCAGDDAAATAPTVAAAASADDATAAAKVATSVVLQFTAPLVGGGQFDGASLAGTPVAFWFWAPG